MLVIERTADEWIDHLAERIRGEYLEMPGLCLTRRQMCRMWLLDVEVCDAVIGELVASGFLRCLANEKFVRAR